MITIFLIYTVHGGLGQWPWLYSFYLVNGGFGEWSDFSGCSKSCEKGLKTRTRLCDSPKPSNGGKMCDGPLQESEVCNDFGCPGNFFYIPNRFLNWPCYLSWSAKKGTDQSSDF